MRAGSGGFPMTGFEKPNTARLVSERLAENANDVDALFVLAAMRVQDGRVDEGLAILDHVLELDPKYPGAWRFKATLYRMQGQADAEQSAWRRAEDAEA